MKLEIEECERVGEKFELQTYLNARDLSIRAADEVILKVEPGMTALDGHSLIKEVFKKFGISKFWHPSKFRISTDTTKSFREPDDSSIFIKSGDICFVDLGPIYQGHEADFGRSFVVGREDKNEKLVQASHLVFQKTADHWRSSSCRGVDLLTFANKEASKLGYRINPTMAGHRLGDFPHKVFSSQKLFSFEKAPIENLWVLEIHLVDEEHRVGAFFEDVLLGSGYSHLEL